jgi:hypothetical protein
MSHVTGRRMSIAAGVGLGCAAAAMLTAAARRAPARLNGEIAPPPIAVAESVQARAARPKRARRASLVALSGALLVLAGALIKAPRAEGALTDAPARP